jgi:hypothetical protein
MSRSYVGAKVRLRCDIRTRAGVRFREGTLMRVSSSNGRGGLALYCYKRGHCMWITGVRRSEVTVVSWTKEDED